MNWSQVEDYLAADDRAVAAARLHRAACGLSLSVDSILSERVATEAAAPLGVPVFPVVPYGITPYFLAYPGSVSLRVATYLALVRDILDGLHAPGLPPHPDGQRPWRQRAGRRARDRVDGRPSRHAP